MKKLESSLKNMLLVLTGVTAISVALLAYVNELTKEPIAQANAKTLSDAVSAVVPGFDNDPIAEKKMQEVKTTYSDPMYSEYSILYILPPKAENISELLWKLLPWVLAVS